LAATLQAELDRATGALSAARQAAVS